MDLDYLTSRRSLAFQFETSRLTWNFPTDQKCVLMCGKCIWSNIVDFQTCSRGKFSLKSNPLLRRKSLWSETEVNYNLSGPIELQWYTTPIWHENWVCTCHRVLQILIHFWQKIWKNWEKLNKFDLAWVDVCLSQYSASSTKKILMTKQ